MSNAIVVDKVLTAEVTNKRGKTNSTKVSHTLFFLLLLISLSLSHQGIFLLARDHSLDYRCLPPDMPSASVSSDVMRVSHWFRSSLVYYLVVKKMKQIGSVVGPLSPAPKFGYRWKDRQT